MSPALTVPLPSHHPGALVGGGVDPVCASGKHLQGLGGTGEPHIPSAGSL